MSESKKAFLRYKTIHKLISSGKYPSRNELRDACVKAVYGDESLGSISLKTIDSDILAMKNNRNLGYFAPIKYSRNMKGFYYLKDGFEIESKSLSDKDLLDIRMAIETLTKYANLPGYENLKGIIDKISDQISTSGNLSDNQGKNSIYFEKIESVAGRVFLKPIYQAIVEKVNINLLYQSFTSNEEKKYTLSPYFLKEYQGRWYVIGYDFERKKTVTFALDRIKSVQLNTNSPFKEAHIKLHKYFDSVIGVTVYDEPIEKVIFEADEVTAKYIKSKPLHKSQREITQNTNNAKVKFELRLIPNFELEMQLLALGAGVKVIEPNNLAVKIRNTLFNAFSNY
jgi:predicted DNA-binding transcriptional regulator YafY